MKYLIPKCWLTGVTILSLTPLVAFGDDLKSNPRWAESLFDQLEVDCGTVPANLDCVRVVTIKNRLNIPIHIAEVSHSAGLDYTKPEKSDLKPGDSVAFEVRPDTRRYRGLKNSTVTVRIDRPDFAEVQIPFRTEIRSDLIVGPGRFDLGNVKLGDAVTKAVAVRYVGDADWKIKSATCEDKAYDVSFREIRRELNIDGKTEVVCEITLTRRADSPTGKIDARVVIALSDSQMKSFSINVTGNAQEKPASISKPVESLKKPAVEPK